MEIAIHKTNIGGDNTLIENEVQEVQASKSNILILLAFFIYFLNGDSLLTFPFFERTYSESRELQDINFPFETLTLMLWTLALRHRFEDGENEVIFTNYKWM